MAECYLEDKPKIFNKSLQSKTLTFASSFLSKVTNFQTNVFPFFICLCTSLPLVDLFYSSTFAFTRPYVQFINTHHPIFILLVCKRPCDVRFTECTLLWPVVIWMDSWNTLGCRLIACHENLVPNYYFIFVGCFNKPKSLVGLP